MNEFTLKVQGLAEKKFAGEDVIIMEGAPSGQVYILKEGRVKIISGESEVQVLEEPGTLIGEIAFMLECDHTATVIADIESTCYVIDDFLAFLKYEPENITKISKQMQQRLMNTGPNGLENLPLDLQLSGCRIERYVAGETIIKEGQSGDDIYVLKEGTLKAISGGNVIFRGNSPGTMFGEISVFTGRKYMITVTTVTRCALYVIDDLPLFFKSNPIASLQVSRFLATRFTDVVNQFTDFKAEVMRNLSQSSGKRFMRRLVQFDELLTRDIMNPFSRKK